ncbi:MAG: translation initiation factor IF-3 [Candidatus Marinimicrobia bacterium]|nr:translation initiation factor IF-3 [Candidatus Neomarinimicrobiota bacterium]
MSNKKENKNRINEEIESLEIRLISSEGEQLGVVSLQKALDAAREAEMDLVEISPDAEPPVCRIMDFGKFRYKQQMKAKKSKKKQHKVKLKEVRFRPNIDSHDFQMKVNHARKFLETGNSVKVTVMFRGRELAHKEFGFDLVDQIVENLADVGSLEKQPQGEGKLINAVIKPK